MSSIKERNEPIPALTEVANDGSSSGSEGNGGEDDDIADEDKNAKRTISPEYARASVIVEDKEHFHAFPEYSQSDDEDDPVVDNLLRLVEQKYPFKNASFVGGVTTVDVIRMREEAKKEATNRKKVKPKQTKHTITSEALSRIERQITTLSETFLTFQNNVLDNFQQLLRKLEDSNGRSGSPSSSQPRNGSNDNVDVQQPEISRPTLHHVGTQNVLSKNDIISEAIRFANQDGTWGKVCRSQSGVPSEAGALCDVDDVTIHPNKATTYKDDDLNGEPMNQQSVHTERQTLSFSDAEFASDDPSDIIPQSKQASTSGAKALNGSQVLQSSVQSEGQNTNECTEEMVIDDTISATIVMDQAKTMCDDALNGEQQLHSAIGSQGQTLNIAGEEMAEEIGLEEMVSSNPPASPDIIQSAPDTERPLPNESVSEVDRKLGNENCDQEDQLFACRKSKRHKTLPKSLVGQYECDKHLLNRSRVALVDPNNTGGSIDYSAKFSSLIDKLKSPFTIRIGQSTFASSDLHEIVRRSNPLQTKVVDVLMGHIRSQITLNTPADQSNNPVFLDTQFVSDLTKLFPKFSKWSKKDTFRFPTNIIERFMSNPQAERFYFPFNLEKIHWMGVCVDSASWSIVVMDCNIALRTDNMMSREVSPIAEMFPYLLKLCRKQLAHKDGRALPIVRIRSIPQNPCPADSSVSAVLLIQAHAVAGVNVCQCITPDVIGSEVERLVVMFYEATVGML
ncbi:Uncharacterized protein Rs2_15959 [Raphanus sativus]|nr:Uncharacterized protein Rs2_15959 [Raphanus sativus]